MSKPSKAINPFLKTDKISSLKERMDLIKEDILEEFCFTQQGNYKGSESEKNRPVFRKTNKQPIYSVSLKMTADTKRIYHHFINEISKGKRFGPGKVLKFLLNYYNKEEKRKKEYMLNILRYLRSIELEINNNSYNSNNKKMSKDLELQVRNLDSYLRVTLMDKSEITQRLPDRKLVSVLELFYLIKKF